MLLSAVAFGQRVPNAAALGFAMQGLSWVAQFLGHGLAEKRAPALLNNLLGGTSPSPIPSPFMPIPLRPPPRRHVKLICLLGRRAALVLAPFFVHLEILFGLGYRPELHKDIQNGVGLEIAKIRKAEGDKKRAEVKKEL